MSYLSELESIKQKVVSPMTKGEIRNVKQLVDKLPSVNSETKKTFLDLVKTFHDKENKSGALSMLVNEKTLHFLSEDMKKSLGRVDVLYMGVTQNNNPLSDKETKDWEQTITKFASQELLDIFETQEGTLVHVGAGGLALKNGYDTSILIRVGDLIHVCVYKDSDVIWDIQPSPIMPSSIFSSFASFFK